MLFRSAAADVLHSSSRPLLYAAAAEDAGGELARTDRGDKALDQLNAAFDTYLHHEALADARRVGRELRRLGVQRRIVSQPRAKAGWDSLTDSELTVVNLIAQGVTNRDVATQLHLSLHDALPISIGAREFSAGVLGSRGVKKRPRRRVKHVRGRQQCLGITFE